MQKGVLSILMAFCSQSLVLVAATYQYCLCWIWFHSSIKWSAPSWATSSSGMAPKEWICKEKHWQLRSLHPQQTHLKSHFRLAPVSLCSLSAICSQRQWKFSWTTSNLADSFSCSCFQGAWRTITPRVPLMLQWCCAVLCSSILD